MDRPACSGLLPVGHGENGLVDGLGALTEALSPSVWLMERPCRELTGRQGGHSARSGREHLFLPISPKSELWGGKPLAPNTCSVAAGFCWKC